MSSNKRTFLDITSDIVMTRDDFTLTEEDISLKLSELYTELSRKEDGVYWFYKKIDKDIELANEYKEKIENESEEILKIINLKHFLGLDNEGQKEYLREILFDFWESQGKRIEQAMELGERKAKKLINAI